MDIVVESETCDPWTHSVLAPGMTCCVLRAQPEEREAGDADTAPAMGALLRALVRRDEKTGRGWVVHVSGPADEVATVVRDAHYRARRPAAGSRRGSTDAGHATFILRPGDRSASELIGGDTGHDRVIALLGVPADRVNFVARALEHGRDAEAVAAADVLVTQQPSLGRSTIARRTPNGKTAGRPLAAVASPPVVGAAVLELPTKAVAARPAHAAGVPPADVGKGRTETRQHRMPLGMAVSAGALVVCLVAAGTALLAQRSTVVAPTSRATPAAALPIASSAPVPPPTAAPAIAAFKGIPVGSPAPLGRLGAATALDGARGQVMVFGGNAADGRALRDTWTFNGSTWTQPHPRRSPPARHGGVATWDPSIKEVVMFGGIAANGSPLDDTWIWDGKAWNNLLPTVAKPPAGIAAGLTFDTARQELVLVTSGSADPAQAGAVDGQTWTWAGTTWGRVNTPASPILTGAATVTYDASAGQSILVDVKSNSTWSFDGSTWVRHAASGLSLDPSAATHAAYNGRIGAVVLVQDGQAGTTPSATWTFDGFSWTLSKATGAPPQTGSLTPDPMTDGVLALSGDASATNLDLRSHLTSGPWGPTPSSPAAPTGG